MIVCDRDHLGLHRRGCRRNAFGRQLASFEADLEVEGIGPEPLRAVFIRAPWVEPARRRGRGAGASSRGIRSRSARASLLCSFHPELTDDSRVHALLMAMATRRGRGARMRAARERAERRGRMRDPRVENLARILVGYSTEVRRGRHLPDRGPDRGRAAGRGGLRGGLDGRRAPDRLAVASTASRPPTSARLRRPARVDLAALELGGRGVGLPDRDLAPTPTPASSPGSRPSARRSASAATRELMETMMERSAEGEHRWVGTLYPTNAYASDAEMSLRRLRGLLLPRLPRRRRRPARRLEARLGGVPPARRVDRGPRGGAGSPPRGPT